jgi:transketolase
VAWRVALTHRHGPVALILTRQNLPVFDRARMAAADGVGRGAYVLLEAEGNTPDVVLIASGSEVALAVEARTQLAQRNIRARVASMPSWELFDQQSQAHRDEVLPPRCASAWPSRQEYHGGGVTMSGLRGTSLASRALAPPRRVRW